MLPTKPLAIFKTDPNQPRKQFTEADLLSLGASLKSLGQLQPGTRSGSAVRAWLVFAVLRALWGRGFFIF
jgi:ParB-like chromosome segregation protein Spo0J